MRSSKHIADGVDVGSVRIHMVVREASQEAEYWTNTDCIVHEDFGKWKKGDLVFVKYNEIRDAVGAYSESKNSRVFYIDGTEVLLVKPDLVYLTIRNGVLIPQDGWCLVKPVPVEEKKSLILVPEFLKEKNKVGVWDVVAVGDKSPADELRYGTDAIPYVGQRILSKDWAGIPLEASLNKKLNDEYYLVRHNEVLAYEV